MFIIFVILFLLPYALGVVPVFLARSRTSRIVAGIFAVVSLALAARVVWDFGHENKSDPVTMMALGLITAVVSAVVTYVLDQIRAQKVLPPVITETRQPIPRGCLVVPGALLLLGVTGYFYLRVPHFHGSNPSSIGIEVRSPEFHGGASEVLLQTNMMSRVACASLFTLLQAGRFRMDHKCAEIGSFAIHYATGKTDTIDILPGHDDARYEFRFGHWLYHVPRDQFYQTLRDAGIDVSKMPQSEH